MQQFYCQADGAQWNVPVKVVQSIVGSGLVLIRETEIGTLVGRLGDDGYYYVIAHNNELHTRPQADDPLPPVNVIPIR